MEKLPNQIERALQVLRAANQALEKNSVELELLESICRIAVEVGGYRFSWVGYLLDDEEIQFVANAGYHSDYLKEILTGWGAVIGQGPASMAISSSAAFVVQNIQNNPDLCPWREQALQYGYESAIALPLLWRGESFGCLTILSAEPDSFDKAEADMLGELATSLSSGISALRANIQRDISETEFRTERDTQEVLRRILSLSLEKIPLEEKLDRVLELLFNIPWLALERKGSVFLVEGQSNTLRLVAKKYLAPVLKDKCASVAFGNCLCGRAAASKKLIFHNHVTEDHETRFEGMPDHGHYCQPILSAQGLVGVLNLYVSASHTPKPIEAPFLSTVADTLAGLIELEQSKMAQQRLNAILDATPDLVTITDAEGRFLYCNDGAKNMFGDKDDFYKQSIHSSYPETVARLFLEKAYPAAMETGAWEGEITLNRQDGGLLPVSQLVIAHRDVSEGEAIYFSTVARDIRDRKRAEIDAQTAALREKNFANTLINSLPGIFFIIDVNGRLMRWNNNFELALGYSANQLRRMTLLQLVTAEDHARIESFSNDARKLGSSSIEVYLLKSDGSHTPFFISGIRIDDSDTDASIVGTGINITERKTAEEKIRQLAFHDPLTNLPNRQLLLDRLQHALASSVRGHQGGAVLFIDLDNFKSLNDTLGHAMGDLLLQQVAERLVACVRESDTVARLGGDEFVVILEDLSGQPIEAAEQAEVVGEKIITALSQIYQLNTHAFRCSGSIGAAVFNEDTHDSEELLKQADIAMYQAKKAGRNTLRFFDQKMQEVINTRAMIEGELHSAIEQQQFELYYQIQVDSLRRPLGAEALIRWNHPVRGLVSPVQFISLAEETGLILPMGLWVLETACAQLKAWEHDEQTQNLVMSVNISARQFHQTEFVEQVKSALTRNAINPALLKLELTESMLLDNTEDTIATMNALKAIGIQLSLDDFGTGYSSLQYLKLLPLNQIKIDQSFVRNIATDPNDAAIVQTIIAMTEALGLDVIAEGVETEAQREFLNLRGCPSFQGYLFGRPVPIKQFMVSLDQLSE